MITIEGIDGSGLSTQSAMLKEHLEQVLGSADQTFFNQNDHSEYLTLNEYKKEILKDFQKENVAVGPVTYLTKEPTDGPIGGEIKEVLTGRLEVDPETLALMFAADRKDHTEDTIRPLIEEGKTVIADRYILSSLAYQGLEIDDINWLMEINSKALEPDLTIMIDVSAEVAKQRIEENRVKTEIYETKKQLSRVRSQYKKCVRKLKNDGYDVRIVDGEQSKDKVNQQILRHVWDKIFEGEQVSLDNW